MVYLMWGKGSEELPFLVGFDQLSAPHDLNSLYYFHIHKRFVIVQLTFHSFYTNIEDLEPFLEIKNDRQLIVNNCKPSFHFFWEISGGVNGTGCRIVFL